MTETAEQTKPAEESFIDQEAKRAQDQFRASQEEAARTREEWRRKWEQQDFSSFIKPETKQAFSNMWAGANPESVEFAAGLSNIDHVEQLNKLPGVFLLKSKFGGEFAYVNHKGMEFIGLTYQQAKSNPLNAETADDIALTAFARGWKSVKVDGTDAEKDMLWLAAQKYGLAVTNHTPSEAALKAFEDYKNKQGGQDNTQTGAGLSSDEPEVKSSFMPVKTTTKPAKNEDIIDAEFTEVKDEPAGGTKFAKKLEGPAKPLLLEGPKNNPPAP